MTSPEQYARRLERTIEILHAELAVSRAETELQFRRAAWREKQRDHLQVELRDLASETSALRDQLEDLGPLVSAAVRYHYAEFMGNRVEGDDRQKVRVEFDDQVDAYRKRVGLSGGPEIEVPF